LRWNNKKVAASFLHYKFRNKSFKEKKKKKRDEEESIIIE
jgi:hypothetical protein